MAKDFLGTSEEISRGSGDDVLAPAKLTPGPQPPGDRRQRSAFSPPLLFDIRLPSKALVNPRRAKNS